MKKEKTKLTKVDAQYLLFDLIIIVGGYFSNCLLVAGGVGLAMICCADALDVIRYKRARYAYNHGILTTNEDFYICLGLTELESAMVRQGKMFECSWLAKRYLMTSNDEKDPAIPRGVKNDHNRDA